MTERSGMIFTTFGESIGRRVSGRGIQKVGQVVAAEDLGKEDFEEYLLV